MLTIGDYQQPPYTTPQLYAAGESILQDLLGGRQRTEGLPAISQQLAARIWQHIHSVQVAQRGSATAATVAADQDDTAAIHLPTHLPNADDDCWKPANAGPVAHQLLFLPPQPPKAKVPGALTVRSDSKQCMSRDFEGAKSGSLVQGQAGRALIVRRHKQPPAGWHVWLFTTCLAKQPQQQQDEPLTAHEQQQQQGNRLLITSPAATALDDAEFTSEFVSRYGSLPEPLGALVDTTTAPRAVAAPAEAVAVPASRLPTTAAAASGSAIPQAAAAVAAATVSASAGSSAAAFNPTHVIAPVQHKQNRQFNTDISVGWLVAVQHTVAQPATAGAVPATAAELQPETSRKRQAIGSAEGGQLTAAAAADLSAAGEADLLQEIQMLRLQSQPFEQLPDSSSNAWTTERQLQLFDPGGPLKQGGSLVGNLQVQLPTDEVDILQLQQAIHGEHIRGRGKNSKGQNVLHLVAMTKHVSMDMRLKQLQTVSGFPGLLQSLLSQQSTAGKTPLMMAAWYDPRPQFTGPPDQGLPIHHNLCWRPDVFYKLLKVSSRKVLRAVDNKGWSVLHRLLHSAALAEADDDPETQQLLLQAYANTLNRMFEAACADLVAAKAAAAWQKHRAQQAMTSGDIPMVDLDPRQFHVALQFVEAVRGLPEPSATASSTRYRGGNQKPAGDALYAQMYPQNQPSSAVLNG